MAAFYLAVFAVAAAFSDLTSATLLGAAGESVRAIDIVNGAALGLALLYLLGGGFHRLTTSGRWLCALLAWLLACVVIGMGRYGVSAFGEFRYALPLFWFFVPPAIEMLRATPDEVEYATVPKTLISLCALAAMLILAVEIAHGGRFYFSAANQERLSGFTDFRGTRYLDSYQTFAIMLAAAASLLAARRYRSPGVLAIALVLLGAALWTQNRTAVLAVMAAFVALAALQRRFALIAYGTAAAALSIALFAVLAPDAFERAYTSYSSALVPVGDDSGAWRFLIQLSAFEQGMQTPLLGQGYGGYFRFELPGRPDVVAPPHNQFLVLFLKGGLVAVALAVIALAAFARELWSSRRRSGLIGSERLQVDVLLLAVLSQFAYGVAYDFVVFLGLLLGCAEVLLQRQGRRARPAPVPASSDVTIGHVAFTR